MIRCHKAYFAKVCADRGVLLADAMPCVVRQDGAIWTVDFNHPAYPRDNSVPWKPVAVGDLVEQCFTSIGVTKERVERWTRTEGRPGGCGCEGRQKWLNEAGDRVRVAIRRRLLAFRDFVLPRT